MAILLLSEVLGTLFKPKNYRIYTKEGMLIVAPLVGYFGPFFGDYRLFCRANPSVIDAFFEMSSGFPTTSQGLPFSTDTGVLTHSSLFCEASPHPIGGDGGAGLCSSHHEQQ